MTTRSILEILCTFLFLSVFAGCSTFETSRVSDEAPAKGFPFIFNKPYTAVVTYTDTSSSVHILSIPTLYAVDVNQSPIGTTDTSIENNDESFPLKTTAKIDHKLPENIGAITDLMKTLGVSFEGAPAPGAPPPTFVPDLDFGKQVQSIDISPID